MGEKNRNRKKYIIPYVLIAPAMIGILVFVIYPVIKLVILSFYDTNMLNPEKTKYVGLLNFQKVFQKASFQKAVINTTVFTLFNVLGILAIALILSVWLGKRESRLNSITQMAIFTPHVISIVSVSLIWMWMMDPSYGLLNVVLRALGLRSSKWLQSSDTAMISVILVSLWKSIGYYTLILIAALQSVPVSIYEAAELDNTGPIRTFFKITLPMISPQIFFCAIIMTIGSFKVFETVRVMTAGGPNNATTTLVYQIYAEVFSHSRIGYGAAVGVVLLVIIGVLTAVYFGTLSKKVHYQ